MMNKIVAIVLSAVVNIGAIAQIESDSLNKDEQEIDDLELGIVGGEEEENLSIDIFSGTRVINGHSVETLLEN